MLKLSKYFRDWKNQKKGNWGEQMMLGQHELIITMNVKTSNTCKIEVKVPHFTYRVINFSQVGNNKN